MGRGCPSGISESGLGVRGECYQTRWGGGYVCGREGVCWGVAGANLFFFWGGGASS